MVLKVNTTLTAKSGGNDTGAAVATSLAETMIVNTTLTELDLSDNSISAAGAASLPEAMKVNTTLTQILCGRITLVTLALIPLLKK